MLNKKILFSVLPSICLLAPIGCSSKSPHLGESVTRTEIEEGVSLTQAETRSLLPSGKLAGSESMLIEAESVVQSINYSTRAITLKTSDGEPMAIIAGPEIQNFAQIIAGDKVKVEYLISVAFEVREPTAEELAASEETLEIAARAKLGEMPAGGAAQSKVKIAIVQAVDKEAASLTLKNLNAASSTTVKAKYPENLTYVKVGDSVVITTLEAFATAVTRID